MKIDAVAFDIDGTLYPTGRMYLLSIPLFLTHPAFFMAFSKVRQQIRRLDRIDDLHTMQSRLLAELLKVSEAEAARLIQNIAYTQWNRCFNRIKPFRGAADTIRKLRALSLKTAVLSDFPLSGRLDAMGLGGLWDVTMSSEDTGRLKPDPRPFLMLAERLGVNPERILYVGNNCEYDVGGAAAAGMKTALIGSCLNKKSKPDIVFKNYHQLWKSINGLYLTGGV